MNHCEYSDRIEAYHDGEIVGDARASLESHLASCDACTAELRQLQAMSTLLSAAPQPRLSQIALHRLHNRVDAAMDGGLRRLGWMMSGIAAGLLLVTSVWMTQIQAAPAAAPAIARAAPPWVGVSTVAETD